MFFCLLEDSYFGEGSALESFPAYSILSEGYLPENTLVYQLRGFLHYFI